MTHQMRLPNIWEKSELCLRSTIFSGRTVGSAWLTAKYVANMNVDVVDLGVPVLSMHAPFEIVSKTDVYMAYRAFFTFFDTKD